MAILHLFNVARNVIYHLTLVEVVPFSLARVDDVIAIDLARTSFQDREMELSIPPHFIRSRLRITTGIPDDKHAGDEHGGNGHPSVPIQHLEH
jgi:hypothetical protein